MTNIQVTLRWLGGVTFEAQSEGSSAAILAGAASLEAKAPPPPLSPSPAPSASLNPSDSPSPSTSPTLSSAGAPGAVEPTPVTARPMRPMEMLLASLGSCGGIDLILILGKQRQAPTNLRIEIEGQRPDGAPAPFTAISIRVSAHGTVDEDKLERAAHLAFEKYCSVRSSLRTDIDVQVSSQVDADAMLHAQT
ncbi:MAG: OsmC family protein [Deltaproteobacteria bacterium]|nr:OsmC family protein [Deltaproteobacteria bacterium]